jgi:Protein of Unknown function (DUF2784)
MLGAHLLFILWVMFGVLVAPRRRWLAALHVASLVYGIVIELGPWPCPPTLAENFFEARAGIAPYQGPFLLHYLDAIVYPNRSSALLTVVGGGICSANLLLYVWRFALTRNKCRSLSDSGRGKPVAK